MIAVTVTDFSVRGNIEDHHGYGYGKYSPGKHYVIFSDAAGLGPLGSFKEFIQNIRRTLLPAAGVNETLETTVV